MILKIDPEKRIPVSRNLKKLFPVLRTTLLSSKPFCQNSCDRSFSSGLKPSILWMNLLQMISKSAFRTPFCFSTPVLRPDKFFDSVHPEKAAFTRWLFNRHPEIPLASVSVPSRHIFDAVQFDKASFANVMKAGVSSGFAGIPAWAYYPLFQVKMKIVEFCRSQFRYFYSSSRMQNRCLWWWFWILLSIWFYLQQFHQTFQKWIVWTVLCA